MASSSSDLSEADIRGAVAKLLKEEPARTKKQVLYQMKKSNPSVDNESVHAAYHALYIPPAEPEEPQPPASPRAKRRRTGKKVYSPGDTREPYKIFSSNGGKTQVSFDDLFGMAADVSNAPARAPERPRQGLPEFPCKGKTRKLTKKGVTPEAQRLIDDGLEVTEVSDVVMEVVAGEVAAINFEDDIFATGRNANFKIAASNGINERGALVDLGLIRKLYDLGAVTVAYILLANHLFSRQNALNFDFEGHKEMKELFTRLAGEVDATAWGNPHPKYGPKEDGRQHAVSKFLFMELAALEKDALTEEERAAVYADLHTDLHTDGNGHGFQRLSLSLVSGGDGASAGSFMLDQALVNPKEKITGHARVGLPLEHGSLYGACDSLRCFNSVGLQHARHLQNMKLGHKLLNVMLEVQPGYMGAYPKALEEAVLFLRKIKFQPRAGWLDESGKWGWWGKQNVANSIYSFYNFRARRQGLVYASVPSLLVHEDLDMTKVARRCLRVAAASSHGRTFGNGHKCVLCAHEGQSGTMVLHNCSTLSHQPYCDFVEICAAAASTTPSNDIMELLHFDDIDTTHNFLARNGIFLTADYMKVNDNERGNSCPETAQLVREYCEKLGVKPSGKSYGRNWILR